MEAFKIEHRIPWSDVDLARIVYFPRYFSYFEMAELEWYRTQGLVYEDVLEGLGIWMPRVGAHCNYRAPAHLAELLSIEMHLERLGRTSYTFGFNAYRLPERIHLADGHIAIVTVARESFRPVPIPAKLTSLLEGLPQERGSA
jgi:YbgC/YbaW family acyl-CoA thioester hydrolase